MKYALYLHVWLSLIAMLLTAESLMLFSIQITYYYPIVFSGSATLFAYNTHTLIALYSQKSNTELTVWAQLQKKWVLGFALLGLVLSAVVGVYAFSVHQWMLLCFAALLWLLYEAYVAQANSKNQNVGGVSAFLKSIILAFVWTVITSALPIVHTNFNSLFEWNCVVFISVRFCLFACITQLFEYRDLYEMPLSKFEVVREDVTEKPYRATLISKLFIAFIVILLFFIEISNIFIAATLLQLIALVFFIRIRNIITITPSMMLWDGVLIVSPIISILHNQL
jgi:hypothetical protein